MTRILSTPRTRFITVLGGEYFAFVYISLSYPYCYEFTKFANNTCRFVDYSFILYTCLKIKEEILKSFFSADYTYRKSNCLGFIVF